MIKLSKSPFQTLVEMAIRRTSNAIQTIDKNLKSRSVDIDCSQMKMQYVEARIPIRVELNTLNQTQLYVLENRNHDR